jgi:hypothetical protein
LTFTDSNDDDITNEENYLESLGKINLETKNIEDNFRRKFLERNPGEVASQVGTELLIDVFALRNSFHTETLASYEGWIGDPLPHNPYRPRANSISATVVNRDKFFSQWNEFTHNTFVGVNWDNIVVAGGAVLGVLIENPINFSFHNSDIDVFVYGLSAEEATKKIFEVCNVINKNTGGGGHVLVSQHSVTLLGIYPFRHVQFVLRLYRWEYFFLEVVNL